MARIGSDTVNIPREKRFDAKSDVFVSMKTIGTNLSYNLSTENISKSGMLLKWNRSVKLPFIEKTILEMNIDPECVWLEAPLRCLGKVTRITPLKQNSEVNSGLQLGIRVIELDSTVREKWLNCIDNLIQKESTVIPTSVVGQS